MPVDCHRKGCYTRFIQPRVTRSTSTPLSLLTQDQQIALYHHPSIIKFEKVFHCSVCNGRLLTCNMRTRNLEKWEPPIQAAPDGSIISPNPTIYHLIPDYKPPYCPHVLNPFLTIRECMMTVHTIKCKGTTQYFFQAKHQGCNLRMEVVWVDRNLGHLNETCKNYKNIGKGCLIGCNKGPFSDQFQEHASHKDKNSNSSGISLEPLPVSQLHSLPRPQQLVASRKLTSFYSAPVAEARASPVDYPVQSFSRLLEKSTFSEHPDAHPAYNPLNTIELLLPYYPHKPNNQCAAIYSHLQAFDTATGQAICALNGSRGLSVPSFLQLMSSSQLCTGCLCEFTPDGYLAHLGHELCNGTEKIHCLNTPACPTVGVQLPNSPVPLLTPPKLPLDVASGLHTATGRPFLAWNSHLGVPQDVWILVSTAIHEIGSIEYMVPVAARKMFNFQALLHDLVNQG
ncbi:hypothetical protein GYMLUDRAFT_62299 [Collybiopsis luxurians FD-317 M1]|uniref:Uncharacterized protein n=1 Tax=Collybiopsis luxurians FD-317 M1 TaxID=944289 RepID=A0A0D0AZ85_9AGAR|nr:hypothetical protein GYMLUDRAFT_62299 [Collybiopsis luxurians FD-317 M1]